MAKGVTKGGKDFGSDASLIGPTTADPALQAKLIEDVIAQKVDVLGLVPLDANVCAPLLKQAHEAGIKVITLEGSNQDGRDWDVGMVDPIDYGETQMKRLAEGMGGKGEYVIIVGGSRRRYTRSGRCRGRLSGEALPGHEAGDRPLRHGRKHRRDAEDGARCPQGASEGHGFMIGGLARTDRRWQCLAGSSGTPRSLSSATCTPGQARGIDPCRLREGMLPVEPGRLGLCQWSPSPA